MKNDHDELDVHELRIRQACVAQEWLATKMRVAPKLVPAKPYEIIRINPKLCMLLYSTCARAVGYVAAGVGFTLTVYLVWTWLAACGLGCDFPPSGFSWQYVLNVFAASAGLFFVGGGMVVMLLGCVVSELTWSALGQCDLDCVHPDTLKEFCKKYDLLKENLGTRLSSRTKPISWGDLQAMLGDVVLEDEAWLEGHATQRESQILSRQKVAVSG